MSIHINKDTFFLETNHTSYIFCIRNKYPVHLYYGEKLPQTDDLRYLISDTIRSGAPYRKEDGICFTKDTVLAECSIFDSGDYRLPSLKISTLDGKNIGDFEYRRHRVFDEREDLPILPCGKGAGAETLCVELKSKSTGTEVALYYCVYSELDVITRYVSVKSLNDAVRIEKTASATLDFENGDFDIVTLQGVVANERHFHRASLPTGVFSLGSAKGASSHAASPFFALCKRGCGENAGDAYAMNFVYSGNFRLETEKTGAGRIRAMIGIDPETFSYTLPAGEIFYSPEVALTFSGNGLNGISQSFHDYIRQKLMPERFAFHSRPVTVNSWEAFYFDIDEKKLFDFAKLVKEAGADTLVVDDGWFSSRRNDCSGLGDWQVSKEVFPNGLKNFAEKLKALEIKLGIWIEPEMVNPDSKLFAEHPDWALGQSDEMQSRNQLVLDMTNPEVVEYLFASFCRIFDGLDICYVKWDMNRYICPYSSAYTVRDGEVAHKYVLGVYTLIRRLEKRYPQILFEHCAAGGGRFDAGIMAFAPQIWTSDNTDPFERAYIQCGTTYAYPVSAMSCHVTKSKNGGTKLETSLDFRYGIATNGTLGYELNLFACKKRELSEMKKQIALYRERENLMLNGDFYRLITPWDCAKYYAYAVVSKDKKQALVSFHTLVHFLNGEEIILRIYGLDDSLFYKTPNGILSGKTLRCAGMKIPLPQRSGESYTVILQAE